MKTDRRHELQTNVLADWIGKHLSQWEAHSKTIIALVLLVAAAAIAGTVLVQQQAARAQVGWNHFFQAFGDRDPEALGRVAVANQGTTPGDWALLAEADLKLSEGIGDLYTNRTNAKENLEQAERTYLTIESLASEDLLRERAWFGLGQVYESLADIDKAKQYYGKLISSSPTSGLGKEAARRTKDLSDPATEKWYNWFAKQTPRPPSIPGMGGDFGLPNLPSDLGNLSDRPDLSVPSVPPADSAPGPASQTTESPEPGPELNSPAAEAKSPAPESSEPSANEPATTPEKADSPEAGKSADESASAEEPSKDEPSAESTSPE